MDIKQKISNLITIANSHGMAFGVAEDFLEKTIITTYFDEDEEPLDDLGIFEHLVEDLPEEIWIVKIKITASKMLLKKDGIVLQDYLNNIAIGEAFLRRISEKNEVKL